MRVPGHASGLVPSSELVAAGGLSVEVPPAPELPFLPLAGMEGVHVPSEADEEEEEEEEEEEYSVGAAAGMMVDAGGEGGADTGFFDDDVDDAQAD